jgi:hypothetical protein
MTDSTMQSIARATGAGSLAFGVVAMLSPGALRRTYGDRVSSGGALDYFGRTWGTRTAVLGALVLTSKTDEEKKRLAYFSAAMNAIDAISAFRGDGMPTSTKVMAGVTSAGFAASSVYIATSM